MRRSVVLGSLATILTILVAGCGGPPLASVEGLVTLDGQPLADVEVQFLPDPEQDTDGPPSSAYTDADGRYRIVAQRREGVVVGNHRVCLYDATIMMPSGGRVLTPEEEAALEDGTQLEGASPLSRRVPRVPPLYSDANSTPFRAIAVEPGTQTQDFPMTSR